MTMRFLAPALAVLHDYDQELSPYRRNQRPARMVLRKVTQPVMVLSVWSRSRVHIARRRRESSCLIHGHLGVPTGGRDHFRCLDRPRAMRVNLWKLKPRQRPLEDSARGGDLSGMEEM